MNWQGSVERTVTALGYEMVDCERSPGGLLRVYIDRIPGHAYPGAERGAVDEAQAEVDPGAEAAAGGNSDANAGPDAGAVTIDDCERVTRQLQYALEVDGCDYTRLEVSSPGLDRPLKRPADFDRFAQSPVDLTLKQAFQGRKKYRGTLRRAADAAAGEARFELVFKDGKDDKVLGFALDEVREARLVPVLDFKGRRRGPAGPDGDPVGGRPAGGMSGGHKQ